MMRASLVVLVAACLLAGASAQGRNCTSGSGYDSTSNQCYKCFAGTFSTGGLNATCQTCPNNTVSLTGFGSCTACPTGTRAFNGRICVCAPGTTPSVPSNITYAAAEGCTACARGTFKAGFNNGACRPCGNFSYSDVGATVCERCDGRTAVRNSDSTGCTCAPGYGNAATLSNITGQYSCPRCAAGTYSTAGTCTTCPVDPLGRPSVAPFGSISVSNCTVCSNSSTLLPPDVQPLTRCYCRSGYTNLTVADGVATCAERPRNSTGFVVGAGCPPGYGLNSTAASGCRKCLAGEYSEGGAGARCLPCPAGTVSLTGRATCKSCPAGTQDRFRKVCVCGPGTTPTNILNIAYDATSGCTPCAPGTFKDIYANSLCKPCPVFGASVSGATACKRCDGRTTVPTADTTDCRCADGYGGAAVNRTNTAGNLVETCPICPAGSYGSGGTCTTCAEGQVSQPGSKLASACSTCDPATTNPPAAGLAPTRCYCKSGYSTLAKDSTTGVVTCTVCAVNYRANGSGACVACASGFVRAAGDNPAGAATTCTPRFG